ncbi:MAG TPA: LysR substrate-binding domain-containing protein [Tahibacter sp.]|uniref:LysR substrate-binding domain-containing protein n=1 Tax=Tahibacter sp. TaxID=2056211 RepID=UPI002D1AD68B|nr:LysR substrate-binding domain-containing protein [Tahibacter sp.]HSX60215.1 LysR substrate-binding domain-containing protein [Tahibacter sp.]
MRDLNDLAFFAAVAEHGGFAAAGRALGIPKSRLSRRMAQLEDDLGVRLVQRSTRRFAVTEIGRQFLVHCRAMLAEAKAAEEAVATQRAEPRGMVRIAAPVELAQNLVASCLPRFLAAYPRVRVQFLVSNRRFDLLNENVDIALRVRPAPDMDPELVTRRIGRAQKVMVAAPAYLDARGRPRHPDDLAAHDTLSLVEMETVQNWTFFPAAGGEPVRVEVEPRLLCGEFNVLMQATLAGSGICGLPATMCGPHVVDGLFEHVLPDWQAGESVIHLVYPSRRGQLPAVRALVEFLVEHLPPIVDARDAEAGCPVQPR